MDRDPTNELTEPQRTPGFPLEAVSTVKIEQVAGLIETSLQSIDRVSGAWEYQILNNVDEAVDSLRGKVPEDRIKTLRDLVEAMIKQPLRRQMGRIRCVHRSLQEVKRVLNSGVQ
jgi:hypothetical protein